MIHLFYKDSLQHLTCTAYFNQEPEEIAVMGRIGIDGKRRKLYVSDHWKRKIFSYDVDSGLTNPNHMPEVKVEMNLPIKSLKLRVWTL